MSLFSDFFRKKSENCLLLLVFCVIILLQEGGKVPLPGARANASPGGVRHLAQASRGWSAKPLARRTSKATLPFPRRTTSAASAANECEEITCLWQVTRNDSDEAERSERSLSGVVSAANGEELAGVARQVRPARAAREWKCFAVGRSSEASGEVRTGDRARRRRAGLEKGPPEPSANDWHPVCGR